MSYASRLSMGKVSPVDAPTARFAAKQAAQYNNRQLPCKTEGIEIPIIYDANGPHVRCRLRLLSSLFAIPLPQSESKLSSQRNGCASRFRNEDREIYRNFVPCSTCMASPHSEIQQIAVRWMQDLKLRFAHEPTIKPVYKLKPEGLVAYGCDSLPSYADLGSS